MTIKLLSICRVLISKYLLPGNKYMIYYLIQIQKDLDKCLKLCQSEWITMHINGKDNKDENIERFSILIINLGNELSAILDTIYYFHNEITNHATKSGQALDINVVLEIIEKYSFHWKQKNNKNKFIENNVTEFEYEESDNSIEFFLPFIWRLICKHSGIHFLNQRIKIFKH